MCHAFPLCCVYSFILILRWLRQGKTYVQLVLCHPSLSCFQKAMFTLKKLQKVEI